MNECPRYSGEVALLVLASKAPKVLECLAQCFSENSFRILVHLDSKVPWENYSRGRQWAENLKFIERRFEIFWGGFNMIRATEALAREALQGSETEVFILLSDDSLPVFSAPTVGRLLREQPNRIDVGISRKNPPFMRRYTEFFFLDSPATSARPIEAHDRCFEEASIDAVRRLAALRRRGKFPFSEVWGGSQWWSLGRKELEAILKELSENLWARESFEFSAIPDESAFQTLYANQVGLSGRSFTGPMFTDTTRTPSPFVFESMGTIPCIPAGKLFIRKIHEDFADSWVRQLQTGISDA